jgi:transmembrane sensor
MTKKMNIKIFKRFYTGTLDRRDEKIMLKSDEVNRLMWEQWEHPEEMKGKLDEPDFDAIFTRIDSNTSEKVKLKHFPILRIVAGFALLIGLAAAFYFSAQRNNSIEQLQFATVSGEFKSFTLPDGSQLWLSGHSKVSYPANFSENRILETEGLVFFKVLKNNTTFKVNAGELSIVVTGTEFSVANYPEASEIEATLVEGIVIVSTNSFKKQLKPNEKITVNKVSGEYLISKVNARELTLWKEPKLSFNNSSLENIAKELSTRYGINFRVTENVADYKFTFNLADETKAQTIELIRTLANVDAKQSGDTVVFSLTKK